MQPFTLTRPSDVDSAVAFTAAEPLAAFVAGATELANWMKVNGALQCWLPRGIPTATSPRCYSSPGGRLKPT